MRRQKPTSEAEQKYQADVALAARLAELLDAARRAESGLHQAQARRAPEAEIRRLAEDLDAGLTAAMRAAYAAQRAEIGPRGYDDRIYRRKAKAKPSVHALTAEAEHLLTLRETHRLNGIPAVEFKPGPLTPMAREARMSGDPGPPRDHQAQEMGLAPVAVAADAAPEAQEGIQEKSVTTGSMLGARNVGTMDRVFKYLSRRGLVIVAMIQPTYSVLRFIQQYAADQKQHFEFRFTPPLSITWIRLGLTVEKGAVAFSFSFPLDLEVTFFRASVASWKKIRGVGIALVLSLIMWLIVIWLFNALITLPQRVAMTIVRCWSATLTAALRSVPILIAIFVIVFTTGDAWRLYGSESNQRFELLILIISLLSIAAMIAAMTRVKGGWRSIANQSRMDTASLAELARKTPARNLVEESVTPVHLPGQFYAAKWLEINIYFLFWFTLIAHLFSVALLVFLAFVLIGMVAVSAAATKMLLQSPSLTILWHVRFFGQSFIVTRPLLLLSALFGCIAALTFAMVNLQDDRNLSNFLDFSLVSYRRSLSALSYYLGCIADLLRRLLEQDVLAQLRQDDRQAILALFQNILSRSNYRVITGFLELARKYKLTDWAGHQGLDILAALPRDRLMRLPSESVEYVLTAAATDEANFAAIQKIRNRFQLAGPE